MPSFYIEGDEVRQSDNAMRSLHKIVNRFPRVLGLGTNYVFTATQFALRNFDTGRYYLPEVTWPEPDQQLKYVTEVVHPIPSNTPPDSVPLSGVNYEFNDSGELTIKHDVTGFFHRWDIDRADDYYNLMELGNASQVAASFSLSGINFLFQARTLYIKALDGSLHAPYLIGPDGEQSLVI